MKGHKIKNTQFFKKTHKIVCSLLLLWALAFNTPNTNNITAWSNYTLKKNPGVYTSVKQMHKESKDDTSEIKSLCWSLFVNTIIFILFSNVLYLIYKKVKNYKTTLYELATKNKLTQLYNETYFKEIANREIKACIRQIQPLCLVVFTIDHFKVLSNIYGLKYVNELLKEISQIAKTNIRSKDIIACLDTGEITILCPYTEKNKAKELTSRLKSEIALIDSKTKITCSFGIAQYKPEQDIVLTKLINRAISALKESKKHGRNATTIV